MILVGDKLINLDTKEKKILLLGLLMSISSTLVLLPLLTSTEFFHMLLDLSIAIVLVSISLFLLYKFYNLNQKFYLATLLIIISSYTAIFTSVGTKLLPDAVDDVIFSSYVIILLIINLIGMILIVATILNKKVVLPLQDATKTSFEAINLLEIQKNEPILISQLFKHPAMLLLRQLCGNS